MLFVRTALLFICLVSLVFVSYAAAKAKFPLRRALVSVLGWVTALAAVNLLAGFTGFCIALNFYTAFVTVVLGAPGVILLLILRLVLLL